MDQPADLDLHCFQDRIYYSDFAWLGLKHGFFQKMSLPGPGVGIGVVPMPVIAPVTPVTLTVLHWGAWQHLGSRGSGTMIQPGCRLYVGHLEQRKHV